MSGLLPHSLILLCCDICVQNTSRSLSQIEIRGSTDVLGEDALRDENDDWGSLIDTTKKNVYCNLFFA